MSIMLTRNRRKGISPLIAAVLLIAFTMAVAAILTAFVTTYTKETTGAVGNESQEIIQCARANMEILGVNSSSSPARVTVQNVGREDLDDGFTAVGFDSSDNFLASVQNTTTFNRSEVHTVDLTFSGTLAEVTVRSIECPEVTDTTTDIG